MTDNLQLLVTGLATGGIYALAAVGFALVWQTSQSVNFAQGEFVMMPAFLVLIGIRWFGLPLWLAILLGIAVSILILGVAFKKWVVDPLLPTGGFSIVIASLGVSLILKESVKEFYSAQPQTFPPLVEATNVTIAGAVVSLQSIVILAVAATVVLALQLFLTRTRIGRCMQATAQNIEVARILGVPVDRMILYTFILNAGLAAIASILVTPIYFANYNNGEMLGLAAFIAAIVGGFNQVRGAIAGGLLFGMIDNFAAAHLSAQYRSAVPLLILILVILFRPQGLFGRAEERTV